MLRYITHKYTMLAMLFVLTLTYQNCDSEHSGLYDIGSIQVEEYVPSFAELNTKIFESKCNQCHNSEAVANPNNNINTDFSNYDSILITAVTVNNPEASPLFEFVYNNVMPLNGEPLSQEELALIYSWINAGAPSDGGQGTITINGAELYESNCSTCHKPLASSEKLGSTAAATRNAILSNQGNMGSLNFLTDEELLAIEDALKK